jgi:transposase InsO family protein
MGQRLPADCRRYSQRLPRNCRRRRYSPSATASATRPSSTAQAWSPRVIGWALATHLRTGLVLAALNMAVAQRRPTAVIHHSDQGCQYTSVAFGKRCAEAGVRPVGRVDHRRSVRGPIRVLNSGNDYRPYHRRDRGAGRRPGESYDGVGASRWPCPDRERACLRGANHASNRQHPSREADRGGLALGGP